MFLKACSFVDVDVWLTGVVDSQERDAPFSERHHGYTCVTLHVMRCYSSTCMLQCASIAGNTCVWETGWTCRHIGYIIDNMQVLIPMLYAQALPSSDMCQF